MEQSEELREDRAAARRRGRGVLRLRPLAEPREGAIDRDLDGGKPGGVLLRQEQLTRQDGAKARDSGEPGKRGAQLLADAIHGLLLRLRGGAMGGFVREQTLGYRVRRGRGM